MERYSSALLALLNPLSLLHEVAQPHAAPLEALFVQPQFTATTLLNSSNSTANPPWSQVLYSPHQNSFNPAFLNALYTATTAALGVFAAFQLVQLIRTPRPLLHRKVSGSYYFKLFLTFLQISHFFTLFSSATDQKESALAHFATLFLVLAVQFYEPKVLVHALASPLLYWPISVLQLLVAVVQNRLSSHKIWPSELGNWHLFGFPTIVLYQILLLVNALVVFTLELAFYQPAFEQDPDIDTEAEGLKINIYSYITFSWITPLIRQIHATGDVLVEDLPLVAYDISCDQTFAKISKQWDYQYTKANRAKAHFKPSRLKFWGPKKALDIKPSLLLAIVFSFIGYTLLSCVFELLDIATSYSQPYLLRKLIQHFTLFIDSKDGKGPPIIQGFIIAVAMFVLSTSRSIFLNQMYILMFKFIFMVETAMSTLIYRKALRLSPQSRKDKPTGEIINHITMDISTIKWFCQSFQDFFGAPIRLVLCLYSLFKLLGVATVGGLVVGALMIPGCVYVNATVYPLFMQMMKYKDERTSYISEILTSIKSIKLYSWEKPIMAKLNSIRNDKELNANKKIGVLNAFLTFLWTCIPFFVSCATYTTFVVLYDAPLTPDIVFPALVYFDLLSETVNLVPNLASSSIEALASLGRVRDYLLLDELDSDESGFFNKSDEPAPQGEAAILVENATFLWSAHDLEKTEFKDEEEQLEQTESSDQSTNKNIALSDVNLIAKSGELTCVVGKVGSGKTTLLRSILGEIPLKAHHFSDEGSVNPNIQINGKIAYCPQSPWILNATVKENILFGHRYDREFYQKTVDACELLSDFKQLPDGDQSVVGEKGISLSGGQKARISLARAVYARSDIYLLDDILSAVDSHVGKNIIKKVLGKDGIIGSRTKVLATNSVQVLHQADQIFLLKSGSITERGTYDDVMERKSDLATLIAEFGHGKDEPEEEEEEEKPKEIEVPEVVDSEEPVDLTTANVAVGAANTEAIGRALRRASVVSYTHDYSNDQDGDGTAIKKTGQSEEFSAKGGVKLLTIWEYCKACNYKLSLFYVVMTFIISMIAVAQKYLLTYWTQHNAELGYTEYSAFFLSIYAGLGISSGAILLLSQYILWSYCIIKGSAYFHEKMANSVLRSPMLYFETTPIGRILNRFTDDIGTIDMQFPWMLIMLLSSVLQGCIALGVIIVNIPVMFFLISALMLLYNYFRSRFIPASRELKRLLKTAKSPVLATIQESVNGVDTIKAFDQKGRFVYRTKNFVDKFILIQYVSQCCNRWLSLRLQFISSGILLFASVLATSTLLTSNPIPPGLLGFIMSFAISITSILSMIVRLWAEVETQSVAVERIMEYCSLKPEAEMIVESNRPPANWPVEGTITFKNYSTRYKENLDPVLRGITATIKDKEKIGIVGRTGAGKSSLTLALFRIIEATQGHIEIDGVDTSQIGLFDLRHNLNIIPQESHTIKGSVRDNLDPFGQYTDEKLWKVLELSHLKAHVEGMETKPTETQIKESKNPDELKTKVGLEAELDESGTNLSAGQRQLLSLARALLNDRTKILVLDEATSSVDVETDKIIQDTIRSEFKDKTILTIAHRLETIMDSDRVLVLDKGQIEEFDSPENLLKNTEGIFYHLCKQGGHLKK